MGWYHSPAIDYRMMHRASTVAAIVLVLVGYSRVDAASVLRFTHLPSAYISRYWHFVPTSYCRDHCDAIMESTPSNPSAYANVRNRND